jgi:hypothetical protein
MGWRRDSLSACSGATWQWDGEEIVRLQELSDNEWRGDSLSAMELLDNGMERRKSVCSGARYLTMGWRGDSPSAVELLENGMERRHIVCLQRI